MDYFFLDKVPWTQSQGLYHAAAYLQHEALFILRPSDPYVCIGFHQDAGQEIDLDFTTANHIPVFRREVGGGAVYLDSGQLFYQLILHKDRQEVPRNKSDFYSKFLAPVVDTYRQFGVDAQYKPVNDIIAKGRKVSGTGAAEINDMVILVGNFILDFNYEMMSKCLRVPDEKFRDKVYKTLQENLSTFLRETGSMPEPRQLGDALARRYETILGSMDWKKDANPEQAALSNRLMTERDVPDWLLANDRRRPDTRQVKIREGVFVIQNMFKAPGGLIRVTAIKDDGLLHDVHLSGDFFFFPAEKLPLLEQALEGTPADMDAIRHVVEAFYISQSVESPGLQPADFARVLTPVLTPA